MQLNWSHAVLYVHDLDKMLDFYMNVLMFQITDRGPLGDGAPDIVFMSQNPEEHHQIAMVPTRKDEKPSNTVNHFAFRVGSFDDVKVMHERLQPIDGINIGPLSHGNTLSIYFNDPEGNGIEIFWDTPWHVAQPQGQPWDITMDEAQALTWVQETFSSEQSFEPKHVYYQRRRETLSS